MDCKYFLLNFAASNHLNTNNMKKLERIPETVVVEREVSQHAADINTAVARMQASIRLIGELGEFVIPCSADVSEWKAAVKSAQKKTETALRECDADAKLTVAQRSELRHQWKALDKKFEQLCAVIIKSLTNYAACKFVWDDTAQTIIPTVSSVEVASDLAIREVPAAANEHAKLLGEAWEAVQKLRKWERRNGVKKLRLEQLFSMSEINFAEQWATDGMKENADFVTQQTAAFKRYLEGQFL